MTCRRRRAPRIDLLRRIGLTPLPGIGEARSCALAIGEAIGMCGAAAVSMLNAVAFSFAATLLGQSQPPAM